MSKCINDDRIGRVDPTPRDPTSLTAVLDFDFEPPLFECGNCRRTIRQDEGFRTIAPSKARFHVGCVSSRIVGSNAVDDAPAQQRPGKGGFKSWP